MPRIGQLRHRLTIQARSDSADGDGFRTEAWSNGDTVSASIEPLGAKELAIADQIMPHTTHRIIIRDGHTINSEDRLSGTVHGGTRVFRVVGIRRLPEDKASSFLELMCQELPGE